MLTKDKASNILLLTAYLSFTFLTIKFFLAPQNKAYLLETSDFYSFLTGAKILRDGKPDKLFDIETQQAYYEEITGVPTDKGFKLYRNPPMLAFLLSPLPVLDPLHAHVVFSLVSIFVVLLGVCLMGKHLKINKNLLLLPVVYIPFMAAIFNGQIVSVLFLLLVLIYISLKNGKPFLGGLLISLFFVKPHLLLITPFIFLISEEKRKFLLGFVLGLAFMYVANVCLFGKNFLVEYTSLLTRSEQKIYGTSVLENFNLTSVGYLISPYLYEDTIVISFVLLVFILWLFSRNEKKLVLELALSISIIFSLILNIHTMASDLLLMLFPLFVLQSDLGLVKRKRDLLKKFSYALLLLPVLGIFGFQWFVSIVFFIVGTALTVGAYSDNIIQT